jgi:prepilin-type N-terminal cleavage/methylation domain-containing protein
MKNRTTSAGFTLAEMAIVLVIVSLLLGGLIVPLSAQMDMRNVNDTQKTINDIRDALLGFSSANGRLPCPASNVSNGVESLSGGACTNPYDGLVPAVTLGIGPTDSNGFAIDAWGNRIHYALFPNSAPIGTVTNIFNTANGIKTATLSSVSAYTAANPLLSVCSSGGAVTGAGTPVAACSAAGKLTDSAVAVIYSLGKNAGSGGSGTDETHNPNPNSGVAPDPAFVSHEPSATPGNEFDDIVIWISPNTLYNRMIAAGQLP